MGKNAARTPNGEFFSISVKPHLSITKYMNSKPNEMAYPADFPLGLIMSARGMAIRVNAKQDKASEIR